jgi:hypothetical protein
VDKIESYKIFEVIDNVECVFPKVVMPLGTLVFSAYINISYQKVEKHINSFTTPAYSFSLSITAFPYYIKILFKNNVNF